MQDLIVVAITIGFFGLCVALVAGAVASWGLPRSTPTTTSRSTRTSRPMSSRARSEEALDVH